MYGTVYDTSLQVSLKMNMSKTKAKALESVDKYVYPHQDYIFLYVYQNQENQCLSKSTGEYSSGGRRLVSWTTF